MTTALEALDLLREGNRRYVAGTRSLEALLGPERRGELVAGQEPFAVVLGCSDSRVPVEIVFDRGLGDLFVIRVAGNVVAASQIGSVEFATAKFGTRLVVVLGHTRCGAVEATLEELRRPAESQSPNLRSIVERIRPSVQELLVETTAESEASHVGRRSGPGFRHTHLVRRAVRANVRVAADRLRHGSELLERLIREDGLLVVGAEYSLETGVVDFFDGIPAAA